MTMSTPRRSRGAATSFIFITVVLDMLAMSLILPVLPRLIQTLDHGAMSYTTTVVGVFATVFAVMQFVVSPIQGALSDRFGRRPIVLASNFGLGADYIVMALAPNLPWLFVGRLIAGVASGSVAAAYAYLADVTEPEKRAASFGLIGAAAGIGSIVGPAIGGQLAAFDLRAPFWVAGALSLTNAMYGLFVLPESLPKDCRHPLVWRQLNPLGALWWLLRTYPRLVPMAGAACLLTLAAQGANVIAPLYTIARYHWSPANIGVLLTGFGVATLVAQAGLVNFVAKWPGERATAILGLLLSIVGLGLFGWAETGTEFWFGVPFMALGSLALPMLAAFFSRMVSPSEQGRLQGARASIDSLMGVFAPGLFAAIFANVVHDEGPRSWIGAPFIVAAGMIAVAAVLVAWATGHPAEAEAGNRRDSQ
ncbi:MAG TPA: MFS transporter [Caulobacteraceae bacterium]|nr:MFS transporter [Caulobacteraceae bacterium]